MPIHVEPMPDPNAGPTGPTEPTGNQPPPPSPTRRVGAKRLEILREKLTVMYMAPMGPLSMAAMAAHHQGDDRLLAAVNQYGTLVPDTVDAWVDLADRNPKVLEMLEGWVNGSTFGTLAVNHVLMVAGFIPPETLEHWKTMLFRRFRRGQAEHNGNGYTP